MIDPASYLGDFVSQRVVLIARVPEDAPEGAQVRAIHILVGEEVKLNANDYWLLQLGRISGGSFMVIAREVAFTGTLSPSVVRRVSVEDPALISRGESLAIRMSPRGLPPPLPGVSLVVEWGVHSSRRASRG
jgi:hypothetical protein